MKKKQATIRRKISTPVGKAYVYKAWPVYVALIFSFLLLFISRWYYQRVLILDATSTHDNTTQEIPHEGSVRIPILVYHYVENVKDKNDKIRQSLNTPPSVLQDQIETLKKQGYTFVTPSYLTRALAHTIIPKKKVVILTFDDGYKDFYTDVLPILKKEEVHAVAYIVPDFLGKPNYMSMSDLESVVDSRWVEIGAHTMDHMSLPDVAPRVMEYQIRESRRVLQDMLHIPVTSFAYPYGHFNDQAAHVVKDAGFSSAMTTKPGAVHTQESLFTLVRLHPEWRTGQSLMQLLTKERYSSDISSL